MGDYVSKYKGDEIDDAIGKALDIDSKLLEKQDKITVIEIEESLILLKENTLFKVSNTSSLTILLPDGSSNDGIEYICEVKVEVDGFILNVPEDVYWIKNSDTEMKKGYIYQISILNNCIIMGEFQYVV